MKQKLISGIILFNLIYILQGCASRKEIVRFQDDTDYLRSQVEVLVNENKEMKKMLQAQLKVVTALENDTRQIKADLISELSGLKEQTGYIDSKLDDHIYQMSRFTGVQTAQAPLNEPGDSADADKKSVRSAVEGNHKDLYDASYLDLTRGNYLMALQGFQQYLSKFPHSELASNAQYWIGETYYAQGEYQSALREFERAVNNYPEGNKQPAALLKAGYCFQKMGDVVSSQKYLKLVIQRFPNSEEARLAASNIKN
ncbi:MAG: tol-pal system protein YbgF [Calditrichaceae bacterium]